MDSGVALGEYVGKNRGMPMMIKEDIGQMKNSG